MAYLEGRRWCEDCRRNVLAHKQIPNHLTHALAAFFTCGLWLAPWLLFAITSAAFDPWRCQRCGSRV